MRLNRYIRWTVGLAFYVLLGVFIMRLVVQLDWNELRQLRPDLGNLALAAPISLLTRFLQPLAWAGLIGAYGDDVPRYRHLTLVYARSWLGRYIPGKVAWLGGKVFWGSRHGVRRRVLAITSISEAGIQLATSIGLALLVLLASDTISRISPDLRIVALVGLCSICVLVAPPVFNAMVARISRRVGYVDASEPLTLSLGAVSQATTMYLLIHVLSGLSVFLLLQAIFGLLPLRELPYVMAASLLAGSAGTLAVFAPSGLGVREGILLLLLVPIIPVEVAVAGVVFLRLWSILLDLIYYLMAEMLGRRVRDEKVA